MNIRLDETEFQDLVLTEAKRIRLAIQNEPDSRVDNDSTISCRIALWNDSVPLVVRSFQFFRRSSNLGLVYLLTADGIKGNLYILVTPYKFIESKLTPVNKSDVDNNEEILSPVEMVQLDESKKTKLIKQNVINIRLQIGGYYTAKLRSAIRLIIAALGSFENCGNVAVSRPIVVYEKYNPEIESVAPLLTAAFCGNATLLNDLLIKRTAPVDQVDSINCSALHIATLYGYEDCIKVLFAHKSDIDLRDDDGRTPLHKAASVGQHVALKLLLVENAAINIQDKDGATALHTAAQSGNIESVKLLLEFKANVKIVDNHGSTALHHAANQNFVDICKLLLDASANPQAKDALDYSPLDLASLRGNTDSLSLLLQYGGKLENGLLLHDAASKGFDKCLKILLENGLPVDSVDENGLTALHKACTCLFDNGNCIKLLLDHSASVSITDSRSSATAFHYSCYYGNFKSISKLLEHSSDIIHQEDNQQRTGLHYACFHNNKEGMSSDIITLLLSRGAELDKEDVNKQTPLMIACAKGNIDGVSILLKYKADLNRKDVHLKSPIHYSCNSVQLLELLIQSNANVNEIDALGNTALFYAVLSNNIDTVSLLMSSGADVHITNNDNQPAWQLTNNPDILQIIKTESEDSVKKEKIFKIYEECAVKFNQKPKSCIEHLSEYMDILSEPNNKPHNVVNQQSDSSTPLDPEEQLVNVIVEFLHNHGTHLNKTKTGEFISEPDELNLKILTKFIQQFHFVDMEFDVALRTFLGKFRLPGEAQKIDRIMEKFAHRYYEENQHHNIFPTEDQAYLLAFSLIMLNTDLHNPSIKHKMTVEQFVKNNTDTGLENDLSPEFLSKMYFCIRDNEIKMETQDTKFGNSVAIKMGWLTKQGGRIKTWKRRWFILSDGVLYYFKEKVQQEETSKACGIVPLEDIVVSESPESKKKGKFCFELSHEENTTMKAMKRNQGQIQKGHHDSYFICASSQQEMKEWIDAIAQNTIRNPFKTLMQKKFKQAKETKDGEEVGDFNKLKQAIELCDLLQVENQATFKEQYTNSIAEFSSHKNIHYALVTYHQHRSQSIVIIGNKWESSATTLKEDLLKRSQLSDHYGIQQLAKTVFKSIKKSLLKNYSVQIIGHSLGGSIGLLLYLPLLQKGYSVSNIITFGCPKSLSDKQISVFEQENLAVLNVILGNDPVPTLFPNHLRYGVRLILLQGVHYCICKEIDLEPVASLHSFVDDVILLNSIGSYIRSINEKIELAVKVQYHLRSHYL